MIKINPARFSRGVRSTACGLALFALFALPAHAAEQRRFATPEDAVGALIEACKPDGDAALIAIFGEKYKHLVIASNPGENAEARTRGCTALKAFHVVEVVGSDKRTLLIGEQAWPFPIPLVRETGEWRFATELGEDEIVARRIGANERHAITVLHAYLDAQRQYASADRNGDGVLEYAQKLGSTPGKQDGLYWPADPASGEELSPFGPLIAASTHRLQGRQAGDPFAGYYFRILTRQGKSAPGGAFSYVINGHMLAGFAMIAYPARYGASGVMSFIVSNSGAIYERDLGPQTLRIAGEIKAFNPTSAWKKL